MIFYWVGWLSVLPALIVSGLMLGALWLFLSVHIRQVENFAGAMNFVMFPMFFLSSALYPLWKLREGGSEIIYLVLGQSVHARRRDDSSCPLRHVRANCDAHRRRSTAVFFLLAVLGYDPQRGMFRRTVQPV